MADLDPTDPWDRRPGETAKAFHAFVRYRDLGPLRSFARLRDHWNDVENQGKPPAPTTVEMWSRDHDWQDRCLAWDEHVDRETRVENVEAIKRMRRNHAAAASAAFAKAAQKIQALDATTLTVREAVMLMDLGHRIERISRGEADHIHEIRGDEQDRIPSGAEVLSALAENPALADLATQLSDVWDLSVVRADGADPAP